MILKAPMFKLIGDRFDNAVQHWTLWLEAQLPLNFSVAVDSPCQCFVHGLRMLPSLPYRAEAR
jgi:hypothetical protein